MGYLIPVYHAGDTAEKQAYTKDQQAPVVEVSAKNQREAHHRIHLKNIGAVKK